VGSDVNTHGHRQNETPEARTATVMISTRSQDTTRCSLEIEHRASRAAAVAVARARLQSRGPAQAKPAEADRAARPPPAGKAEAARLLVGPVQPVLAGICGDEAADATFPLCLSRPAATPGATSPSRWCSGGMVSAGRDRRLLFGGRA